jgi:WD40 repeat protein
MYWGKTGRNVFSSLPKHEEKKTQNKNSVSVSNLVSASALAVFILSSYVLIAFPVQVAHALDGNLYVVSSGSGTSEIKRYNSNTGAFVDNFVPESTGFLRDITFRPDGNLYVVSSGSDTSSEIKRYNGTTGAFIDNITLSGGSDGGPVSPGDLTFGPDGNLYGIVEPPHALGEIKRYNGTTGVFIDTFVSAGSGGLSHPTEITFGPDGNLYAGGIGAPIFGSPGDIKRYNGTTGAFINTFVPASSGGLAQPTDMTFGPDGNLYVSSMAFEIKRYNGTTGAFIDTFVPAHTGGLLNTDSLAFGPDGNLFLSSGPSPNEIKRYNGTTGAFIDTFVPAGSGGLRSVGDMAFAALPPSAPQEHTLTVNAIDLTGKAISGVWTVIRTASDGSIVKTGYTPVTFTGHSDIQYNVSVANYDGKVFKQWEDVSTSNVRTITLTKDTMITATYDTGDSLRGFTPMTFAGTTEQPDLTVNALTVGTNKPLHMWTVIDPQQSSAASTSAEMTAYKVYAGNYRDLVFDHWNDGNKDRIRTLTISSATTITAYYRTEPQNLKVEFAYKDCGLSSAGCGVGTITCADGTTEGPGPISLAFGFTVSKSSGNPVDGIWRAVIPGAAGPSGASGALTTLSFDGAANSIKTEGDLSSGSICNGDPLPSATNNIKVTFSGVCGGTEVRYEATNGVKATIQGDITCTTS